jgi:Fe-S-cluster containining protein
VAACCKQNGHDFAVLLQGDLERRRFAPWSQDVRLANDEGVERSERVIAYVGGRCPFLGEDDRCRIYDDRPQACRTFQCVADYASEGVGRHGRFLRLNPHVLSMLEAL